MKNLAPVFNTSRMVSQYADNYYMKALERRKYILENEWEEAKKYSSWKSKIIKNWKSLKFVSVSEENEKSEMKVDSTYQLVCEVDLGKLSPDDVAIQIYYGKIDDRYETNANNFVVMNFIESGDERNIHKFSGEINCKKTGNFGFTLRILPKHELLHNPFELNLIHWA